MDFNIELVHLKEEIFKELRELESKFLDMFVKKSSEIEDKNKTSLEKIDSMMSKNEQMFNSINNQQIKFEKIVELETFKNKINDMIITHELRIKNISKDLEDIKFKYDREITRNLSVPGFVGPSCQFKTLSEYLLFNIGEINKLKTDKTLTKKENKEIRTKYDALMKNIFNLVDNSVTRCNEYTDNKQKYFEKLLNTKLNEINEKNMEMKTKVMTNQRIVEEEIKKIIELSDGLTKIKDDIGSIINNKYDELNIVMKDLKNKIDKINNEVKKNNKNYENLNNSIKKSGLFTNNNDINLRTINNELNKKFQKRHTMINVNKNIYNNTINNTNTNNNTLKSENTSKDNKQKRSTKKVNSVIQKKNYGINDKIKINKTIEKSLNINLNKEGKMLNIKEYKTINNQTNNNNKNKEEKKYTKSLNNLNNNININPYKSQYNSIFNKKKEINDIMNIEDKLSTERKIKNIQKKIMKKNKKNKKITFSDDEMDKNKNKTKMSNIFQKITLGRNSTVNESKSKKENDITNSNNKSDSNSNIKPKNKNEIQNLKRYSLFNKKKNILVKSRNSLFLEKFTEPIPITDFEENNKNRIF